jgi:uncharacterized protein (DUF302 family)
MMKFIISTIGALFLFQSNAIAQEMVELPEDCTSIELDMIKCPLEVSMDDAADSMKLRANLLNFKLVAHMPLSEQVKSMGGESPRMEIFQFCDALIASKMVAQSLAFSGYLPCRIAMVEGKDGTDWLVTLTMDDTIGAADLPEELKVMGMKVRNNIYSIVQAGVVGDF